MRKDKLLILTFLIPCIFSMLHSVLFSARLPLILLSPVDDLVHNLLLFRAGSSQINSRRLNAFMAH